MKGKLQVEFMQQKKSIDQVNKMFSFGSKMRHLYIVFMVWYLIPVCFLLTINSKDEIRDTKRVCGTVGISVDKTVLLKEGASLLTPEEFHSIQIYENGIIDKDVFESIRVGKLVNALFTPGTNLTDPEKCVLEICGCSYTASEEYQLGSCEVYHAPIRAPPEIYDENYELSSISCACSKEDVHCIDETCVAKNAVHTWNGKVCAVMFQEEECQSCYFKPIDLLYEQNFLCLNSFQFESMLIRPGCYVEQKANGVLWIDDPRIYKYENVTSKIEATLHKDSENFTCICSSEVVQEMMFGTTTEKPVTPTIQPDSPTTALPLLQSSAIALSTVIVVVIIIMIVAAFFVKRYRNRQHSSNSEDAVISETMGRIYYGSTEGTFPIETIHLDDLPTSSTLPDSATFRNTEVNSSGESDFDETNDKSSPVEVVGNVENHEEASQNEIIRLEILQRLLGSFVAALGQDELRYWPKERNILTGEVATQSAKDGKFNTIEDNFLQVCKPEHVLTRNMFTITKQSWDNPVGGGLFGTVYKGQLKLEANGLVEKVAVKKIKLNGTREGAVESFIREIETFECIESEPNDFIVKFFGACCHPDGLYILTKFCEGGSLKEHLVKQMRPKVFPNHGSETDSLGYTFTPAPKLDLVQLLDWCAQISSGMEYLSTKKIIHVDLAAAARNVLLSKDNTVKICDFGLSRKCSNTEYYTMSLESGSFPLNSFAPEVIKKNINEPKKVSLYVDIWAFGCTAWEMFTLGESLYQCVQKQGLDTLLGLRRLLLTDYRHPKPELAPDFVYEKIMECWNEVPKKRPSFKSLSNFFKIKRLEVEAV